MAADLVEKLLQGRVKSALFGADHAPRLGRLLILDEIGSGAMGTVLAAYDPTLDRKVAVKVLASDGPQSTRRILNEARALGKLAHPNVVAVHDTGEVEGAVYIVMELVPGWNLRRWAGENERSWREAVRVMAEAGAGLAAAHRAGLVHSDVKPENILVGDDGRVRVADFGLARIARGASEPGVERDPDAGSGDRSAVPIALAATSPETTTELGGTPVYMAPEVLAGAATTAAGDQFSFGVTLYELVSGARPHGGANLDELRESAAAAARAPRRRDAAPRWLHEVIVGCLAEDPADRHPSMDAVVAELRRDRRRSIRWVAAVLAAAALAATVGGIAYQSGATRDECDGSRAIAPSWNQDRRARVIDRLGGARWADRLVAELDAAADGWRQSYRRICQERRAMSPALFDLRMHCLTRHRDRLSALAGELEGATGGGGVAPEATEGLSRPERCETLLDPGELALPAAEADRREVEAASRDIDRTWAAYVVGRYQTARELAAALDEGTRELGFAPTRAQVLLLVGTAEARAGDGARGRAALLEALGEAAASGAAELEVEIWLRLLRHEMFAGSRHRTLEWAPFARAAARRAGTGLAEIDGTIAEALRGLGRADEARALLVGALEAGEPLRGDRRALLEMNLGSVDLLAGDAESAARAFERALEAARSQLGDDHPGMALHIDKLGEARRAQGRLDEALALHDQALAIRRAAHGPDDRSLASTLLRRATTRLEHGQIANALADLREARRIRAEVYGPDHRRLAEIERALADVARAAGRDEEAEQHDREAARLDPDAARQ